MQDSDTHTSGIAASDLPHVVVERTSQPAAQGRRTRWIAVAALAAAALVALAFLGPRVADMARPEPGVGVPPNPAPSALAGRAAPTVVAIGRIEPMHGVISISTSRETRNAVVADLHVDVGSRVSAGDPVAVLETLPRADAVVARAAANVLVQEAELARARRELEASVAEAQASIAVARSRLEGAEAALARSERLGVSNMVSAAQIEELRTNRAVLAAELARAEAQLERVSGELESHPDLMAARAALAAAEADARLAQVDRAEATVRAPRDGRIVAVAVRVGEPAPADGIARLSADGPMAALLEVHQDRIHLVRVGASVRLRAPALEGELQGRIVRIGLEVRRQAQFESDPAANTDARVFEVEAELDEASSRIAKDLLNLQVLAAIEVGGAW